jgi:hypothetical protein
VAVDAGKSNKFQREIARKQPGARGGLRGKRITILVCQNGNSTAWTFRRGPVLSEHRKERWNHAEVQATTILQENPTSLSGSFQQVA